MENTDYKNMIDYINQTVKDWYERESGSTGARTGMAVVMNASNRSLTGLDLEGLREISRMINVSYNTELETVVHRLANLSLQIQISIPEEHYNTLRNNFASAVSKHGHIKTKTVLAEVNNNPPLILLPFIARLILSKP